LVCDVALSVGRTSRPPHAPDTEQPTCKTSSDHPTHVPPHFDWLASGSGFDRRQFLALWEDVARFILR